MNKLVGVIIFIGIAAFLAYMLITGHVSIAWERVIIYALIGGGISLVGRARAVKQKKQDEEYFRQHPQETQQGDALWKSVDPRTAQGDVQGKSVDPRTAQGDVQGKSADPGTAQGDALWKSVDPGATQGDALWKSVDPRVAQQDALRKNAGPEAAQGDAGDSSGARSPASGVVRPGTGRRGIVYFLLIFIWLMILCCTALAATYGAFADMDAATIGSYGALIAVAAVATFALIWLLNNFCCELYYTPGGVTVKMGRKERHYSWGEIDSYTQRYYLYTFRDRGGKRLFYTNGFYEDFGGFFDQYLRTHNRA